MKCPKCGFNSFEAYDACKKCGGDLTAFKAAMGIRPIIFPGALPAAAAQAEESGSGEMYFPEDAGDPGDASIPATGTGGWDEDRPGLPPAMDEDPFGLGLPDAAPAGTSGSEPLSLGSTDDFGEFSLDSFDSDQPPEAPAPQASSEGLSFDSDWSAFAPDGEEGELEK